MPYLVKCAKEAVDTGFPLMRAMVIEYENDPNVYGLEDQYMLGDSLLVAPMINEGAVSRNVYLPKGKWLNWNTSEILEGGRVIEVKAPLNQIPLFVKDGSAILMKKEFDSDELKILAFHVDSDVCVNYRYKDDEISACVKGEGVSVISKKGNSISVEIIK